MSGDEKGKKRVVEGIPEAEIRNAMTSHSLVAIKVNRQNTLGKWQTVYAFMQVSLEQLISIDAYLQQHAGGGDYHVAVRAIDGSDLGEIPDFKFKIEGNARVASGVGGPAAPLPQQGSPLIQGAVGMPGMPGMPGMVPPTMVPQTLGGMGMGPPPGQPYEAPPWPPEYRFYTGYPLAQQWEMFRNAFPQHPTVVMERQLMVQQAHGAHSMAPGQTIPSDQLALSYERRAAQEVARVQMENAKLLERLDRLTHETEEARVRHEAERRESELRALDARHEAANMALRAQIESLRQTLAAPAQPQQPQLLQVATALAPFVPVFSAMVSKDDSAKDLKMFEIMLKGQQKPDNNSTLELMKVALPIVGPLLLQLIQARSPEAQSELIAASTQQQMAMLKMMADFIDSHAQQDTTPWWYPMVAQVLEGVKGVAGAALDQAKGQEVRRLPSGDPTGQQTQQTPPQGAYMAADDELFKTDAAAAANVRTVLNAPVKELAGFRTYEWKVLLFNLYIKLDVNEIVPVVVDHLEHLRMFNMLPATIGDIFQVPAKIGLLAQLPNVDKVYTDAVVRGVISEITSRERERAKVRAETAQENAVVETKAETIVTPAPVPIISVTREEWEAGKANGAGEEAAEASGPDDEEDDEEDEDDDEEPTGGAEAVGHA